MTGPEQRHSRTRQLPRVPRYPPLSSTHDQIPLTPTEPIGDREFNFVRDVESVRRGPGIVRRILAGIFDPLFRETADRKRSK